MPFFSKLYIHFLAYMLHFIIYLKSVNRKESKEKKAKSIVKREAIEMARQD